MEIDWTLFWSCFIAAGFGSAVQHWRSRKVYGQLWRLYASYLRIYKATGTPTPLNGDFSYISEAFIKEMISVGKDSLESNGVLEEVYKVHAANRRRYLKEKTNGR